MPNNQTELDAEAAESTTSPGPHDAPEGAAHFGRRLEVLLNLAGVSQRQIAQAAGMDPSTLSRLKQSVDARNEEIGRLGEALESLGREELRDATKMLLGLKALPTAQRPKSAAFVYADGVLAAAGYGNEPSVTAIQTLGERHRDLVVGLTYTTLQNPKGPDLAKAFEAHGFKCRDLTSHVDELVIRVAGDVIEAVHRGVSVYIFVGFPDSLGSIAGALRKIGMHVIIGLPSGARLTALALEGSTVVRIPPSTEERRRDVPLSDIERVVIEHMIDPGPTFTPSYGGFTFPYLVNGLQKCHQHREGFTNEDQAAEAVRSCLDKGILNQGGVRVPGEARSIELDLTHPLVRKHLETKIRR